MPMSTVAFHTLGCKVNQYDTQAMLEKFRAAGYEDGVARYEADIIPERTGMYQVATRIYPKNPALPHRQDFALVRWL